MGGWNKTETLLLPGCATVVCGFWFKVESSDQKLKFPWPIISPQYYENLITHQAVVLFWVCFDVSGISCDQTTWKLIGSLR